MFSQACVKNSVGRGGKVHTLGRHPLGRHPLWADIPLSRPTWADPPGQTPPWADTPLGRHPPGADPPGQTPPLQWSDGMHPAGMHNYCPQMKLREGNVFTGVCDSVHRGMPGPRGGYLVFGGWYLVLGGVWSRGVPGGDPPGWPLLRVVRILLECILLVLLNFWKISVLFVGPLLSLFWTPGDVSHMFTKPLAFFCCLYTIDSSDSTLARHLPHRVKQGRRSTY